MKPELRSLIEHLLQGPEPELGARIRARLDTWSELPALAPPVLICGCGHSGTTLLLSILGAHPALMAVPFESSFARRPLVVAQDFQDLFALFCRMNGRQRWVEKTPMHIHFLPQLLALQPRARVILCLRDGRDVACSIRNRHGDFGMGVARWIKDNRASEPLWSHPQIHLLRYEDLVADFESTIRTLTEFLGEQWDPRLLSYHQYAEEYFGGVARKTLPGVLRTVLQTRPSKKGPDQANSPNNFEYRYWQMSQPVFDGRGIWQEQMSLRERQIFKAVAGEILIRYGYATDQAW